VGENKVKKEFRRLFSRFSPLEHSKRRRGWGRRRCQWLRRQRLHSSQISETKEISNAVPIHLQSVTNQLRARKSLYTCVVAAGYQEQRKRQTSLMHLRAWGRELTSKRYVFAPETLKFSRQTLNAIKAFFVAIVHTSRVHFSLLFYRTKNLLCASRRRQKGALPRRSEKLRRGGRNPVSG